MFTRDNCGETSPNSHATNNLMNGYDNDKNWIVVIIVWHC